jgi:hypothetical protein
VRNPYPSLSGPGCVSHLDLRFCSTVSYIREKGEKDLATDTVVEGLIVDLLLWLANGERTYEEVMDAWRTSCPKLPVWEEANDRGLVTHERVNGRTVIRPSSSGIALLDQRAHGGRTGARQIRADADRAQFEKAE